MADNDGYYGTQRPEDTSSEYNALAFVVRSILAGHNFAALVQVVHVDAPGGLALAGTVDVQPLVNQLDGQGNAVPHGVVNQLPYVRAQGGANAIILDPQVGDIGLAVFCDRDSSSAQSARGFANPGSARRSDMADGIYFGGLLNAVPNQYVMFGADGISVVSPTAIKMQAPEIDLTAPVVKIVASTSTTITTPTLTLNGALTATGTITAPNVVGTTDVSFGGKSGINHKHGGVATGSGTSGAPV